MNDIVIASAARTPVGSFNGALSSLPAHELATVALKSAFERAGVSPADVDELILGQILAAGEGHEPGPPGRAQRRPAGRKNRLRRRPALRLGPARGHPGGPADPHRRSTVLAAGGMESMSAARHAAHLRNGTKMGPLEYIDAIWKNRLLASSTGYQPWRSAHPGFVGDEFQITATIRTGLASP